MVFGQYNKKERRKKSLHVTRVKVRVVERLDRMSISNLLTSDFINELGPKTWNSCETVIIFALNNFLIKSTASGKFRWLPMRNRSSAVLIRRPFPCVEFASHSLEDTFVWTSKWNDCTVICFAPATQSNHYFLLPSKIGRMFHLIRNFFRTTQKETIWWNGETFFASFKSLNTQLESYLPQCRSATPTNGRV